MEKVKLGKAKLAEGFPIRPLSYYIWVLEYGQPDRMEPDSLIHIPTMEFARYKASEWRYGEVVAVGPGRYVCRKMPDGSLFRTTIIPEVEPGDIVMFSRRHGTRFAIKWKDLFVRVLDPSQCQLVVEGFEPWWDTGECQGRPDNEMSG